MFNFNRKEKGQGLVEYALILVLVAVIVIVVLQVLGPLVGSVFTEVNSGLTVSSVSSTTSTTETTGLGCNDIHPDGYATGPGYGWDCYSPSVGAYNMP